MIMSASDMLLTLFTDMETLRDENNNIAGLIETAWVGEAAEAYKKQWEVFQDDVLVTQNEILLLADKIKAFEDLPL